MKAQIIQIGNSQGIRIPKMMLEETGISGEVDLQIMPDGSSSERPASRVAIGTGRFAESDDELSEDINTPGDFERKEWQW